MPSFELPGRDPAWALYASSQSWLPASHGSDNPLFSMASPAAPQQRGELLDEVDWVRITMRRCLVRRSLIARSAAHIVGFLVSLGRIPARSTSAPVDEYTQNTTHGDPRLMGRCDRLVGDTPYLSTSHAPHNRPVADRHLRP